MPVAKYLDIYLLRHGHSSANGKGVLAGRDNSVSLSEIGEKQAHDVAAAFSDTKFEAFISSPIARCLQTLKPIPDKVIKDARFQEMDYGEWSGKKLTQLSKKELWKDIQSHPSTVRFPKGESFLEMHARASDGLSQLAATYKGNILLCSHGDVIKAMLAHAMGLHLDSFQKLIIDPASISIIRISGSSMQVVKTNDTSHLIPHKSRPKSRGYLLGGGSGAST